MSQLSEKKMISASDALSNVFSDCVREFDHICPKCGEKIYHTFNNKSGVDKIDFYTMCLCQERSYELEAIQKLKNNKAEIIKNNKSRCGFVQRDLDELNMKTITHKGNIEAYDAIIEYADNFSKNVTMGFYIYGETGVGKSLLAKKCMAKILNKGFSAYITSVSKLMNDIKKEYNNSTRITFDWCIDVDLLVLDDFGAERCTDHDLDQLFLLLETRWRECKPIIITSNLNLQELSTRYDKYGRIYSRVIGTCRPILVKDKDRRIEGVEL
jgi:DNA replication protein DnaC|uniref:Replicative helicase n=1 Tax=Siphoviridae sp. ctGuJ10 TaxID=2825418 RepID=A0A8S5PSR0_9CAUD|nr:MAG TPA: Replicative helicase [Siphoviridae sp. ctGuJ10]